MPAGYAVCPAQAGVTRVLTPLLFALALPSCVSSGQTVVSLEFDDGTADSYLARPMLAHHGMHATFFVNSGHIGRPGRLTWTDLHDLQDDGHEIAGHTLDHVHLPAASYEEQVRQSCDDRKALIAHGFAAKNFAYPFGELDSTTPWIVARCGYESARRVGGIQSGGSCWLCDEAESIPPADLYAMRTPGSIRSTTDLDTMKSYVTQAQHHGGGWVQIVMHHVCDGCSPYSIRANTLAAFLDWLADARAKGSVRVQTVQEILDRS